ncbi:cobalamin-dependent protein [Nonomuraea wenchangensis]|uniref:cobalamin-dependent protein n=1 Tax=Nonomuraea wenchangensis TaxID=568860 RepID=UPI00384D8671
MGRAGQYSILLAGVGGDAHAVGLTILKAGIQQAGYHVDFLGTQNLPAEVCSRATQVDAVLISNMDGHAAYYLDDLPELQAKHGVADRLWYLGGYPSLTNDDEKVERLERLGFDRIFHGYVDVAHVLKVLDADLATRQPLHECRIAAPYDFRSAAVTDDLPAQRPRRLRGLHWAEREEVLYSWRTGWGARDLEANAARLATRAQLAEHQRAAQQDGHILIQPRSGVSDPIRQRALFVMLRDAGADVLSFQIDSLTRNNMYAEIEQITKQPTRPTEGSRLNGFPAVNLGVEVMAQLSEHFSALPMQVRHSTRDPRLLAEITFAAGIGAFEGGGLSYNLPYFRDYPVRESLERWCYVDCLAAHYFSEFGIVIDREFFGVLTACLVPPSTAVAVNIFEALLAAQCGVKSVTLGYAEQGHREQDLAAVRVLRSLACEYLSAFGHEDVQVHIVWHQYMGPFPRSKTKARQLLAGSAESAGRSQAVRLMLKTDAEARRIPSAEENRDSLTLVREICVRERTRRRDPAPPESTEEWLIRTEARSVLDHALSEADNDPFQAVVEAVRQGWLDVPFSPSRWNAGRVLPVRDCEGAVRFAAKGRLPLPDEVVSFHAEAVARRRARDSDRIEELIAADLALTAEGRFDAWPLD